MLKILSLLIFIVLKLYSIELVVIGDKNFSENNLTTEEIRAFFLDKKHFTQDRGEKILVMNHKVNHPLRQCFEKKILKKTKRSLERYWRKAYYQGKHPPKVVSSNEMLFSYLDTIHPSIGYSDVNETIESNVTLLYRVYCEE